MSYNPKHLANAQRLALETAWPKVPQDVFARLGVTTDTLHSIESDMLGTLIMPGMADYEKARMGKGLSPFDKGSPELIFQCEDAEDVWVAMQVIRKHGWPFVVRSGGHSTAGYSSDCETVIDLSGLNDLSVHDDNLVSVGPGVTFARFNRFMRQIRRHVPSGGCSDVGCAGYVQGGGFGYTSRQYGMQCDRVVEAVVLLADGTTVVANEKTNPDLFWALRGGTGGNFGIVLKITYETVAMEKVWGFSLRWPAKDAPAALFAAQEAYGLDTGLEIGYMGNITTYKNPASGNYEPVYMFSGICVHGKEVGMQALQPLLKTGNPEMLYDKTDYFVTVNSEVEGQLPGIPPPINDTFEIKSSNYIDTPMTLKAWAEVFQYFVDNIAKTNPFNVVFIEAYGGAINKVAPDETAFLHRGALMDIYIDAFWRAESELGSFDSAKVWMDDYNELLGQYSNGHWYQNYPQRDMPNYRWQYFGDNYNSLLFVKQKFDSESVFTYEQSITPYPQSGNLQRSTEPSKWSDAMITRTGITQAFEV